MYIKGFTYGFDGKKGSFQTTQAISSQKQLFETGINYMCFAFPVRQEQEQSTEIYFNYKETLTQRDIKSVVRHAHERKIKVCLKPMLTTNHGLWKPTGFKENDVDFEEKWKMWFASYTEFILYYAQLAQDIECEMLCVGNETLGGMECKEEWSTLIDKIHSVFRGTLVFHINEVEEKLVSKEKFEWLTKLDYVGTKATFPRAKSAGITLESMIFEWRKLARKLKMFYQIYGRPILFMESGCESNERFCMSLDEKRTIEEKERPLPNQEVQANYYDSVLSAFHDQPWFYGAFWWGWSTTVCEEDRGKDISHRIDGKEAYDVICHWYRKVL